ncbi:hypothetical protein AAur_pTC20116 (plasmid) [Paenarthrobacter aurescens TC1]|uniref:Uncharacterized protein n=1 Tax=Paenarthrobacter aurescens (strain TC1) TaxID=290340 RepID=A1RDG5_PAEAT|nr:hypothetical protein AAur_pTC20116 [Paenarthrobacter aurescens TC1]
MQTGPAARNELNGSRFHTIKGSDGVLYSPDTMPAGQAFNAELNCTSVGGRSGWLG